MLAWVSSRWAIGLTFIRVLYVGEDLADRLWRGPSRLRRAPGGSAWVLLLAAPELMAQDTRFWNALLAVST